MMPEATLYEAALHAPAITDYLAHAIPAQLTISIDARRRAHLATAKWRKSDPAASRRKNSTIDPTATAKLLLDAVTELACSPDSPQPGSPEKD